ncbi:beta-Ig-H3/fasciclin [Streptomyces abyssomicinicus]|uniref:beta-Ig-H3/fasciclin n=1 Tax=Streptomyces abyssomicinicus TaxID=574929 RepID=UPI00125031AF|nr:beta-Ig-H3/fasciclin [Streptomyces abyssomicinicus]
MSPKRVRGPSTRRTAVIAAAGVTVGATAAALWPSDPAAAAGPTAPACVRQYVNPTPAGFDVHLTNDCARTARVRVVVDNAGDSPCFRLAPKDSVIHTHESITGAYERTVTC